MKFCEECGAQLEDDAVFCEECGTRVEPLFMVAPSEAVNISGDTENNIQKDEAAEPVSENIVFNNPKIEHTELPETVVPAEERTEVAAGEEIEAVEEIESLEEVETTEEKIETVSDALNQSQVLIEETSKEFTEPETEPVTESKSVTEPENVTEPATEISDEPVIQKSNEIQKNLDENTGKEKKKSHKILIIAASVSAFVLVLIGALYFFVLRDKLGKRTTDSEIALEDTEKQSEDTQEVVTDTENQTTDSQNSATDNQIAESESSEESIDENSILAKLDLGAGADEKTFFDNLELNYDDDDINEHQIYYDEDGIVTFCGYPDADDPQVIKLKSEYNQKNVTIVGYWALSNRENLQVVVIPVGYSRIEDNAFDYSQKLLAVFIPSTVTYISDHAFNSNPDVSIYCVSGSYAETYANEFGIKCVLLSCTAADTSNKNTTVIPGIVATDEYASSDERLRVNLDYEALNYYESSDPSKEESLLYKLLDNLACRRSIEVTSEEDVYSILNGNPEALVSFYGLESNGGETNSMAYHPSYVPSWNDWETATQGFLLETLEYDVYSIIGSYVNLSEASNAEIINKDNADYITNSIGLAGWMGDVYYMHDVSNIDYIDTNCWKVTASIYQYYSEYNYDDGSEKVIDTPYTSVNFYLQYNEYSYYGFNVIGYEILY